MATIIRTAGIADHDTIRALIADSARGLGRDDYSEQQIEAALTSAWGLDTRLVADGTYFIVEVDGEPAACGGWSFRKTLFGSDGVGARDDAELDPGSEPARIRAFFVRPKFARRGLGSLLMRRCESAAVAAGFTALSLGATAPGLRLYSRHGFTTSAAPIDYDLGNGLSMSIVPMLKNLA